MESDDIFYGIGLDFAQGSDLNDKSVLPSNTLVTLSEEIQNAKKKVSELSGYTKDGRPRDVFSIVVKPDSSFVNPDPTGNGVSTESLNAYYDTSESGAKAKSKLNNICNIFVLGRQILNKTVKTLDINPYKLNAMNVIYNNLVGSLSIVKGCKYDVNKFDANACYHFYTDYFNAFLETRFDLYDKNKQKEIIKINPPIANSNYFISFGAVKNDKPRKLHDICNSWDKLNECIGSIYKMYNFVKDIDFINIMNDKMKEIKKYIKGNTNEMDGAMMYSLVSNIYEKAIYSTNMIMDFCETIVFIMDYVMPKADKSFHTLNPKSYAFRIEKINPWISADYHLLKELTKGDTTCERSEEIIKMHNKYVKPKDVFFFLGDLSESEIFDQNNQKYISKLIEMCNRLNGIKIMIKGNNDTGRNEIYKKCGFVEIYDDPILLDKHVFSHGPIITYNNVINVHGHIHGSKNYWGVDPKDHIDVYYGIYGRPMKLSELDKFKTMLEYQQGCKKTNPPLNQSDPETLKSPININ
jgi:calcineurin-like phosphoesterase family protein